MAAHFGHVIKKEPSGMVLDYRLRVPGFVDWEITYSSFIVTLKPPSTVMLTLRDLERVFGPSEAPDWDNAKPGATVAGAEPSYEQLEFAHPAGRRTCVIGAMVADTQGDASTRRVLSFFFSD
ncbi:MAG TPA: hypothetical protein VHB97_07920 [Polyangia bacterium]|nr:hypothetical protein [Polyangia bacterium]